MFILSSEVLRVGNYGVTELDKQKLQPKKFAWVNKDWEGQWCIWVKSLAIEILPLRGKIVFIYFINPIFYLRNSG